MSTIGRPIEDLTKAGVDATNVDDVIAANRAATPGAVLEQRKAPRLSIREINESDLDTLRERINAAPPGDDRGPVEKVLDVIDLPRNLVANAAASLIAPGAKAEALAQNSRGTGGLTRVYTSDILRHLGVQNRVVNAVAGFAGDVLLDPLTYAGGAGAGIRLSANIGGRSAEVGFRRAGTKAMRRSIASVAKGGAPVDELAGRYLNAAGLMRKADELRKSGAKSKEISRVLTEGVFGQASGGFKGLVEKTLLPLRGERSYGGSGLARDLALGGADRELTNQALKVSGLTADELAARVGAARDFAGKYGRGTGPSLRIGTGGAIGMEVAHLPFTDRTIQVPFLTGRGGVDRIVQASAKNSAVTAAQIQRDRDGLMIGPRGLDTQMALNEQRSAYAAGRMAVSNLEPVEREHALTLRAHGQGLADAAAGAGMAEDTGDPFYAAYRQGWEEESARRQPVSGPNQPPQTFRPGQEKPLFDGRSGGPPDTLPPDEAGATANRPLPDPIGPGGANVPPAAEGQGGTQVRGPGQVDRAGVAPRRAKVGEFSRADIERRAGDIARGELEADLIDLDAEALKHADTLGGRSPGNAFSYYGELPGELKSIVEGRPQLFRMLRKVDSPSRAGWSEWMQALGPERYEKALLQAAGGKALEGRASLDLARKGQDPAGQFLAFLHDSAPKGRLSWDVVDSPGDLPDGASFTISGKRFTVVDDGNTRVAVEQFDNLDPDAPDLPEGFSFPLAYLDGLPHDRGSLVLPAAAEDLDALQARYAAAKDPAEKAALLRRIGEVQEAKAPKLASETGQAQEGVFGQEVLDPATGTQRTMFGDTRPDTPVVGGSKIDRAEEINRTAADPTQTSMFAKETPNAAPVAGPNPELKVQEALNKGPEGAGASHGGGVPHYDLSVQAEAESFFDSQKTGSPFSATAFRTGDKNNLERGVFFGDKAFVDEMAIRTGLPAHSKTIRLTNPLVVWSKRSYLNDLASAGDATAERLGKEMDLAMSRFDPGNPASFVDHSEAEKYIAATARASGHDGIVSKFDSEIVVLNNDAILPPGAPVNQYRSPDVRPLNTPARGGSGTGNVPDLPPFRETPSSGGFGGGTGNDQAAFLGPGDGPEPLRPLQASEARLAAARAAHEDVMKGLRDRMRAASDRVRALEAKLDAVDPDTLGVKSLDDAVILANTLEEAELLAARLDAEHGAIQRAAQMGLTPGDPETNVRELTQRLIAAGRSEADAGDEASTLLQQSKSVSGDLDKLADDVSHAFTTARRYADYLKAAVSSLDSSDMEALRDFAKVAMGTDDSQIAGSLFQPFADAARKRWGSEAWTSRMLESLDRAWRRTLGVRGGALRAQAVAIKNTRSRAEIARAAGYRRIEQRVAGVLDQFDIPSSRLGEALDLHQAMLFQRADPGGATYNWQKWTPSGPAGDSTLLETIKRARADWAGKPGAFEALEKAADDTLREVMALGDQSVREGMLSSMMARYVPLQLKRGAQQEASEISAAFLNGPKWAAGKPKFDRRRTTWQTRFLDPEALPTSQGVLPGQEPQGRWRRFFEWQRALADVDDRGLEQIARQGALDDADFAERLQELTEARSAIKRYDELRTRVPGFEGQYPARPTDHYELNELAASGHFRPLYGRQVGADEMFETNAAQIFGGQLGMHQMAAGRANLWKMLSSEGVVNPRESIQAVIQQRDATGQRMERVLANGMRVKLAGLVPSNDAAKSPVPGFYVGDELWRYLGENTVNKSGAMFREMLGDKLADVALPAKLADVIDDMEAVAEPTTILRAADKITSAWKTVTLMRPSWVAFNVIGDTWLALSAGANPEAMARQARPMLALRMLRDASPEELAKVTIKLSDGRTISGDKLAADLMGSRLWDNSLSYETAAQIYGRKISNLPDDANIARKGLAHVHDQLMRNVVGPWFRANGVIQDTMRSIVYLSFLEQGHSPEAAVSKTLSAMLDYGDFTRIEEGTFRRLIPFYSWLRANSGYQFNLLAQRPAVAALAPKIKQALEEAIDGEQRVPQSMRPNWMRDQLAVQIGTDKESRFALMLGQALPMSDMYSMLTPIVGVDGAQKFLHYFASNLNAGLTGPLSIATGREFFSGRSIAPGAGGGDMSIGDALTGQVAPLADYGKLGTALGFGAGLGAGALAGAKIGGLAGPVAGVAGAGLGALAGSLATGSGRIGEAYGRGVAQGVGRQAMGGRVQAFDEARLSSSVARQFKDREATIRTAVWRAERRGDQAESLRMRVELMRLYRDMIERGMGEDVPVFAREQLAG